MTRLLLDSGANIEAKDKDGRTPLYHAVLKEYLNVFILLLERGADIEAKDKSNQAPIDYAKGSIKTILKKRKSFLLHIDKNGNTALHNAIRNGEVQNALIYVRNGVALDMIDREGNAPLHLAIIYKFDVVSKA